MNLYKRSFISLHRCFKKTTALFLLVFVLAFFAISSMLIRQAVVNTHLNLQNQLPAIATIRLDQQALSNTFRGEELPPRYALQITGETIREIGNLPYVSKFEYSAFWHRLLSHQLRRFFDPKLFLLTENPMVVDHDWGSLSWTGLDELEQFTLKGVNRSEVLDIESGLIHLVQGRVFTSSEMVEGKPVAIVSQQFLKENQLQIGDFFSLEERISNPSEDKITAPEAYFSEDNIIANKFIELEIIGTFERKLEEDYVLDWNDIHRHHEFKNRIYAPIAVIESIMNFRKNVLIETRPLGFEYAVAEYLDVENREELLRFEQIMFLLHSPTQMTDFRIAAEKILSEFWVVDDMTHVYADIAASMETINDVSYYFMVGASIASLITLSLLIVLFFRDRKQEFGIYLALGERKAKLLLQNLLEVLTTSVLAISAALLISFPLASAVSTAMLQTHLASLPVENDFRNFYLNSPEALGFRVEMTHEEMLQAWNISLDVEIVVSFYLISLFTVAASMLVPSLYLMKMSPKTILNLT